MRVMDAPCHTAGQLRNLTHTHAAWQKCDAQGEREIDYRLFFDDADNVDAEAMCELMELEQEDRDVIAALRRSATPTVSNHQARTHTA